MAAFVRRRLGREVFDRLVEPLVSAVYAADLEKLSVLATLSRFREMEREYGSLIRAMRHQMKNRPTVEQRKRRPLQHVRHARRRPVEPGRRDCRAAAARARCSSTRRSRGSSVAATVARWRAGDGGRRTGKCSEMLRNRQSEAAVPDPPSPSASAPLRRPDPRHALAGDGEAAAADRRGAGRRSGLDRPLRHGHRLAGLRGRSDRPSAGRDGRGGAGHRAEPHPGVQFQQPEVSASGAGRARSCCGCSWAGPAGRNWPRWTTTNCGRWCWTNCRGCCEFAASRATATLPIGPARCRNITSATRSWSPGSRPAWRRCPIWRWPATPITASGIPDCIHGGELAAERIVSV